jgi:membrane-associated phospholipid phosphatase
MNDNHKKLLALLTLGTMMLLFLVLATLGAYSRVYLSQHFLSDVCMGSIIGFVTPCLIFYFGRHKILKLKLNETKND